MGGPLSPYLPGRREVFGSFAADIGCGRVRRTATTTRLSTLEAGNAKMPRLVERFFVAVSVTVEGLRDRAVRNVKVQLSC